MRPEKSAAAPRENTPSFVVWTLGLGGLATLAVGIVSLISASSYASWPTVQGVITGHRIESSRYQKKISYDYAVGVNYAYELEHQRHTGRSFSHATETLPLPSYGSREAAEAAYQSDPGFRNWQGSGSPCIMTRSNLRTRFCKKVQTGSPGLSVFWAQLCS